MEAVSTLQGGRTFTVADLESMPDDGHRYELIDGALIVTPAPVVRHQIVLTEMLWLLKAGCPPEMLALPAPVDVILSEDTGVQPDIVVARRTDFTTANLPVAPLLAVEILSPSTRLIDLNVKRDRYRRAGVKSYWLVDPDELRLTALELGEDGYVEVADVRGEEEWTATSPYPVTITPGRLAD